MLMADLASFPLVSVPVLRQLFNRFSYKPNWSFRIYQVGNDPLAYPHDDNRSGVYIKIEMYVENSRTPFQPWDFNRMTEDGHRERERFYEEALYERGYKGMVPYRPPSTYSPPRPVQPVGGDFEVPASIDSEPEFWDWLHFAVAYVEDHERDEWFKVDGRIPYDPHNPQNPMLDPSDWKWEEHKSGRAPGTKRTV